MAKEYLVFLDFSKDERKIEKIFESNLEKNIVFQIWFSHATKSRWKFYRLRMSGIIGMPGVFVKMQQPGIAVFVGQVAEYRPPKSILQRMRRPPARRKLGVNGPDFFLAFAIEHQGNGVSSDKPPLAHHVGSHQLQAAFRQGGM